MNDVTDTEYFSDTNVRITRSRAIFEDKMYPMASIASVGMITTPGVDTRTVSKISGSIILVLALGAAIWVPTIEFEFVRVVLYAGAASVAAVGFFIFVSGENIPEQYTLVLVNASGESKVLVSVEKRYIEKVISAINTAIVHRGQSLIHFNRCSGNTEMHVVREANLERVVADTISNTAIGEKVKIRFTGLAIPVEVMMRFAGGWEVGYTLVPGIPLEFIRGQEGYGEGLSITLMPHDDLKQQVLAGSVVN